MIFSHNIFVGSKYDLRIKLKINSQFILFSKVCSEHVQPIQETGLICVKTESGRERKASFCSCARWLSVFPIMSVALWPHTKRRKKGSRQQKKENEKKVEVISRDMEIE